MKIQRVKRAIKTYSFARTVPLFFAEYQLAIEANIPVLPLRFTGGAAAEVKDTLDASLKEKVKELQTLKSNIDRLGPLIVEIVEEQSAIQRSK
jgi:hypothetical protein